MNKEVIKIAPKLSVCVKRTTLYLNIRILVIGTSWFLCVFFAQSCASTTTRHIWIGEGINAEALQERGEFSQAAAKYKRLLEDPPDVEHRRWISYKLAELDRDQGDIDAARVKAKAIVGEKITDEYGAKALLLMAQMQKKIDTNAHNAVLADGTVLHFDDENKLYWDVIRMFPDTYEAEKSLKYLERQTKTNAEKSGFATRLREQIDNTNSSLEDNLLLAEARAYIEIEKPNKALKVLRELFFLDEEESLADNALWEMAALYRDAQQWQDALDVYDLFRDRIEASWFVGTYTPDLVNDSIFESGKIALLFLNDYALSAAYFEDYLTLFPDTLLADDALWFLSESHRLAGNIKKQNESLERLAELFPESKYLRRRTKLSRKNGRDNAVQAKVAKQSYQRVAS